ncbi:VOC family protein [Paeniglutamicibacter sp. R2-26]|uniref:VOC family protein n=1 Tax=Paeniglutamicibacter sp. R2-26 TaxID=3144417 RepID=UPI003EE56770
MDLSIQVTLDCLDPHTQAAWWARTLGWEVERTDPDFIRRMVDEGHASEADTIEFDGELVWRVGAGICPHDQVGLTPRQRMLFQRVPEPKTVKNRMHLDLHPGRDKDELRDELVARGASFLHAGNQGPFSWYTLADPEGNEFCIS